MKTKIIFILLCFLSLNVMGQGVITRNKCNTCGKVISRCPYKGKHPAKPTPKPTPTPKPKPKPTPKPTPTPAPAKPVVTTSGTLNGHEWVDLGLSVKWATCNVGASSPSDYGGYYAWGETSTKSRYDWENLKYRTSGDSKNNVKFSKYVTESKYGSVDNKTHLELSDDAARANWGGSWRMPTNAEFQELINKCTWTWTTMNGKNGYKVVSKSNGNSIFLPIAGFRYEWTLYLSRFDGDYWSSSLDESDANYARSLYFNSDNHHTDSSNRSCGLSVRPVCP